MDRQRFSCIAHGDMPVWNPISLGHLQRYVSQLRLPVGGTILDIGCGRGHLLQLILAAFPATAVGVDTSSYAMAVARQALSEHVASGRLTLVEQSFDANAYLAGPFDLVICVGSTHAAAGYLATLRVARGLLRSGGLLLVGEGYWKQAPAQEYLDFLATSEGELTRHSGNQARGIGEGFDLLSCSECTLQEWDAYEGRYARNVEEFVQAHEDDPDAKAMLLRIRPWREAYLRWGRVILGCGLYLFRLRPGNGADDRASPGMV